MKCLYWPLAAVIILASYAAPTGRHAAAHESQKPGPREAKRAWRDYPIRSPFEAVHWRDAVPEVQVDGVWYELLALDELPAATIVATCRKLDPNKWQKRFEEDLVEVLARMQHEAGETVRLSVCRIDTGKSAVLAAVPMTEEKRKRAAPSGK